MGSPQLRAFHPVFPNNTKVVTASTSSQVATLSTSNAFPTATQALRVVNLGSDTIFLEFGNSTATAVITTSMPMLGNTTSIFTLSQGTLAVAYIGAAGGNSVYLTVGEGL